ncbi:Zn-ribbon domain-containing OB-fold protein [Mesorhizobium sp. IMUNJ 23033]|uniref:Zn-ribbon domain-containing OB-fold protein n=1 Tax=Mesorhizobium sp. IMUNJ 23033 TaxID=3378039 RepID=UPI00384B2CD9
MNTPARPPPKSSPGPLATGWPAERRFVVQECRGCDKPIMYPKRVCPHCLGDDLSWRASTGKGEI